jgi:hypothetical protein
MGAGTAIIYDLEIPCHGGNMSRAPHVAPLPTLSSATVELSVSQKLILGAVGAVTPLALNLLVVDQLTLANLTFLTFIGYTIRVLVLLGLGSLIVYLNIDESNRVRVFQLGLAAPALITALLNGANQRSLLQSQQFVTPPTAGIFVATVHAQETERPRQFVIPKESQGEQVWRGLTGSRSDRVWFVIAKREETKEAAELSAAYVNGTFKGFHAVVFEPYQGRGSWSVVIGAGLTRADAMTLRHKAVQAGMADADLWTPPDEQQKK